MAQTRKSSEITISEVHSLLPRYQLLLRHIVMRDGEKKRKTGGLLGGNLLLDQERYLELPARVQERKRNSGQVWVEKPELESLMQWKLKHGKFRPQLPALIASNPSSLVKSITKEAFAVYSSSDPPESATAITLLCKLKGVGPATASLLLSVYDPVHAPFFSDELFRWICWDEKAGWDRKIKYDAKEYCMLCGGVQTLMERFGSGAGGADGTGVQAVELEKVAYVLGKSARDQKLAAAIEEEVGKAAGVGEEGKGAREMSPPASKRAKLGGDADSKSWGGQATGMGEAEKFGDAAEEVAGKAATSTPPMLPARAGGAETSDRSTRRTSQRTTRGRRGGEYNDEEAVAAPVNKQKRKSKSDS